MVKGKKGLLVGIIVPFFLSFLTVYSEEAPQATKEETPRISIITSVYNGDLFIENFLADIVQQTVFKQCELIMINANSPGKEEETIKKYMERYPNIIYKKLAKDPGVYGVWNIGVKMARGEFITNANLDDHLKFDCYEVHMKVLEQNPGVDLVYSDFYITKILNDTFDKNSATQRSVMPEFSPKLMKVALPNNHPMWRKKMHDKYGFFDEKYLSAGDWEFWLRAVEVGAKFMRVPGIYGLLYDNPVGLSNNKDNGVLMTKERAEIYHRFKHMFV